MENDSKKDITKLKMIGPNIIAPPANMPDSNAIKFSIDQILGKSNNPIANQNATDITRLPTTQQSTLKSPITPAYYGMTSQLSSDATHSDSDELCDDIDVNDEDDDEDGDVTGVPHDVTQIALAPDDPDRFSWLHCTRYKPPKLPRSKRKDVSRKRKLGRNPRVPFTQHQVSVLESKFRQTHYLSSVDVAELSAALNLTETRVKIWFQNRRARERRDKNSPADLMLKEHSASPPYTEKSPSHLPHHPPFSAPRVTPSDETGLNSMATHNPLQSMLHTHWGYYQALHGLYGYRTLANPLARSLQYYDVTTGNRAQRIMTLRQSAFSPVTSETDGGGITNEPPL